MSTKTTFKRVALVAVAALGLGMISVAPSTAAAGVPTLTTATGSASVTTGAANETTTAATVSVVGLLTTGIDSYSVQILRKSAPATAGSVSFRVAYMETSTAETTRIAHAANETNTAATGAGLRVAIATYGLSGANRAVTMYDSVTADSSGAYWLDSNASAGYVGAKFGLMVDSAAVSTRVAGTYVYTAIVTPYSNGGTAGTPVTADLTFTITDTAENVAAKSGTIDPSKTTAWLNAGSSYTTANDSAVAVVATAATTDHAFLRVKTMTSTSLAAPESVTVTLTGAGIVCYTKSAVTTCGKNLVATGAGNSTAGTEDFTIRADGTAGTGTIVVKTTSVTFPAKTVTFFAKSPKTITASINKPVIGTSSETGVIYATAVDADGNNWGGTLYVKASAAADALIAGSATVPAACSYNAAKKRHECDLAGKLEGTSNLVVVDQTLDTDGTYAAADSAATSSAVAIRVSTLPAASVKLAFDKATYGPGEQAIITATVADANGNAIGARSITALFASGGITSNVALTLVSSTALSTTDLSTSGATSNTTPTAPTRPGAVTYVVNMPQSSGTVTISATGGTGLAAAGQVAVSATAEVVNASVDAATDAANEATDAANAATDAALAAADAADAATAAAQDASDAVAALSAEVSKMIASLKAQITSLTNLVIKIQKKVKA